MWRDVERSGEVWWDAEMVMMVMVTANDHIFPTAKLMLDVVYMSQLAR